MDIHTLFKLSSVLDTFFVLLFLSLFVLLFLSLFVFLYGCFFTV